MAEITSQTEQDALVAWGFLAPSNPMWIGGYAFVDNNFVWKRNSAQVITFLYYMFAFIFHSEKNYFIVILAWLIHLLDFW